MTVVQAFLPESGAFVVEGAGVRGWALAWEEEGEAALRAGRRWRKVDLREIGDIVRRFREKGFSTYRERMGLRGGQTVDKVQELAMS